MVSWSRCVVAWLWNVVTWFWNVIARFWNMVARFWNMIARFWNVIAWSWWMVRRIWCRISTIVGSCWESRKQSIMSLKIRVYNRFWLQHCALNSDQHCSCEELASHSKNNNNIEASFCLIKKTHEHIPSF